MKLLIVALALLGSSASAQQSQINVDKDNCFGFAKGAVSRYMADTGDGKIATLYAQNQKCTATRVKNLSKAHRRFNEAVEDGTDWDKVVTTAKGVRRQRLRATMYTSCHNTMLRNAEIVGSIVNATVQKVSGNMCF